MPQKVSDESLKIARRHAAAMQKGSRRTNIPLRTRFIRDLETSPGETADTPLKRLVRAGDSDGLTLRLYLALLWRCSAPPYETEIPARMWAELLALPEPMQSQQRRIAHALRRLEEQKLVTVTRTKPGKAPTITLLDESGDGTEYTPPRGSTDPHDRWVKVPVSLWQDERFHTLTTPGLAMLLAILADRSSESTPLWWTVEVFTRRIGLTPSTRSRGTKELHAARLLKLGRERVSRTDRFAPEQVRNTYTLTLEPKTAIEELLAPRDKGTRRRRTTRRASQDR